MKSSIDARMQAHPHLQRRWKAVGRTLAFGADSAQKWRSWRRRLRARLRTLTGYSTMRKAPLKPRITEKVDRGDHIRQRVEIQTEPGMVMPLYVLIPKTAGPFRAVMAPHGHGLSGGKLAVAGCREVPEVAETIDKHNYDYGVQFVREGLIVFCPDARGFGERLEETAAEPLGSSCAIINQMAYPLGQTITGMWAWDLSRLIDYIQTRPDCIRGRLGCAGLSGGGLQTLWATALDDRITAAVISGYFYGAKQSLLDESCCSCNYVPHLWEYADMGDIGALIAPRPLLIETGDQDDLNGADGVANVKRQVRITRKAFRLLGAARRLRHVIFGGEHRWHGEVSVPWMRKELE